MDEHAEYDEQAWLDQLENLMSRVETPDDRRRMRELAGLVNSDDDRENDARKCGRYIDEEERQ